MVELEAMKNLKLTETDNPVKKKEENSQGSSSDVNFSDANMAEKKHNEFNERSIEVTQLPPSKWTNLAHAFRVGLFHDSHNLPNKDVASSLQHEMKPMDKRVSLGKMFRHGFQSAQRPTSARAYTESAFDTAASQAETSQSTEKGKKWNFFKHGISHHNMSPGNEERPTSKDESKRRPLSRILHLKSHVPRAQDGNILDPLDGSLNQTQMPMPETRGHSLGKLFRHNKNPPRLKDYINNAEKPVSEKIYEIDLQQDH